MGGAGIAGIALLGAASPAMGDTTVSADKLGISPGNSPEENRRKLVEALSNSKKSVHFPDGEYLLNNSGNLGISNFEGKLTMASGARFVFTDASKRGITFDSGKGARLEGLTAVYQTLPAKRNSSESGIIIRLTTDTVIRDISIEGSNSCGLVIGNCVRPSLDGVSIRNTMADGLHFRNCEDAKVNDLLTENTGDDG